MEKQNNSSTADAAQGAGQQSPANVATSASQGDQSSTNPNSSTEALERRLAELEAKNKELEKDNFQQRDEMRKKKAADDAAQKAALAEQGEFRKLYEQQQTELLSLKATAEQYTTLQTRYTALSDLISTQLEAEIKDWPASVKDLDPGKDAGIEARLTWRQKASKIVADLHQQQKSVVHGNAPGPKASGGTAESTQALYEQRLRSQYRKV